MIAQHDGKMEEVIRLALREDIGLGDITTECTVPTDLPGIGTFLSKANGILSGIDIVETVLAMVDERLEIRRHLENGFPLLRGTKIATVRGPVASMLTAERTALNFLQRMSGIATMTASMVKLVEGRAVKILDTRKTAPGLRAFDKRAVRDGRGSNHRFGLDDMILIKDNHIAAAGSITDAVALVLARMPEGRRLRVEVETRSLRDVFEALSCDGVDVIMLDNFAIDELAPAVRLVKAKKPNIEVEASGNVSESTIVDIADSGVDSISIGGLTHSVRALDISFDISTNE